MLLIHSVHLEKREKYFLNENLQEIKLDSSLLSSFFVDCVLMSVSMFAVIESFQRLMEKIRRKPKRQQLSVFMKSYSKHKMQR